MLKNIFLVFLFINSSFVHMSFENYETNRNERMYENSENINLDINPHTSKVFRSKKSFGQKSNGKESLNSDNSGVLRKLKIKNQISVAANNTIRNELLNEFLALKIYEFSDKINMMAIPEFRVIFESVIKIIKKSKNTNEDDELIELGATSCILEEYALKVINTSVPICPWRWVVLRRLDKYPFKRSSVKCNCEKCQAKTIYDSDLSPLSTCQPAFSLYPVLLRESNSNGIEKWSFALEEIANSCVCSLKLNPQS